MMPDADIVIKNAHIFTSDEANPRAQAVAVKGNRIVYVGDDSGADAYCGAQTRVIDGAGRTLTAGFIDSHVHLLSGATWMGYAELREVYSKAELKAVLRTYAESNSTAAWIIGWRAHYEVISTRQELDEIIADRPVYIRSADAHTAWANTKALELAGILRSSDFSRPGAKRLKSLLHVDDENILRDEHGIATGELRESGMRAVLDIIPPPDDAYLRAQLKKAVHGFNMTGITSVHNMNGNMQDLITYAALEDAGELNLRVYVPFVVKPETTESELEEASAMAQVRDGYVRGGAAKFFMDGVWESYTAFNVEPYADDPQVRVEPLFSLERFTHLASACDRLGLQIAVHCCGDAAVRQTLDGYAAVQRANGGRRNGRHRIEHVEVCQPEDMTRFGELGVIASVQLSHAPFNLAEAGVAQHRLGEKRWRYWQPWRDLKEAGARMAFGSDWTVVPYDPLTHFHVALNREKLSAACRDQRLTLEECILGYTRDAAYVEFKEHEKGMVKVGYLADLVLFSDDLFQVKSEDILSVRVVLTIFDGKIVFER